MLQNVPRIMAMMVASIEGNLIMQPQRQTVSDTDKLAILNELKILLESIDMACFDSEKVYPLLGYVVNTLLRLATTTTCIPSNGRIIAWQLLHTLFRRHPHDNFIDTIVPGVLTILLKNLPGWEKEPKALVKEHLATILVILRRGSKRIRDDGKVDIVIGKLVELARGIGCCPELSDCYVNVLLDGLWELNTSYQINRGLALIASQDDLHVQMIRAKSSNEAIRMFINRIDFILEEFDYVPQKVQLSSFEDYLEELLGLLRIVPSELWPPCTSLIDILTATVSCPKETKIIAIDSYGFEHSLGRVAKSILYHLGSQGYSLSLSLDTFPSRIWLMLIGPWASGLSSIKRRLEVLDYLIDSFDQCCSLDPNPSGNMCIAAEEQDNWLLSWCCALFGCLSNVSFNEQFLYAQRPLLALMGSPLFLVKDAAEQILDQLSCSAGLDSISQLLQSRFDILFDQIATDLRFPTLFPTAPRQLAQLLTISCNTPLSNPGILISIIRDLEDKAAEFQTYPAYITSLLYCFQVIIERVGHGRTSLCDTKVGKEEESDTLEPSLTLEQELMAAIIKTTIHFVTDEQDRVRLQSTKILCAAVDLFNDGHQESVDAFLPLAHLTWGPLLARLNDVNFNVAKAALTTIAKQTLVAGDFLGSRVRKELFPLVGQLLARESLQSERSHCVGLLVDILWRIGASASSNNSKLVMNMATSIIQMCDRSINVDTTVDLLLALSKIDGDQLWYVLVVQFSELCRLENPKLPNIDLCPFKKNLFLTHSQRTAVIRANQLLQQTSKYKFY